MANTNCAYKISATTLNYLFKLEHFLWLRHRPYIYLYLLSTMRGLLALCLYGLSVLQENYYFMDAPLSVYTAADVVLYIAAREMNFAKFSLG